MSSDLDNLLNKVDQWKFKLHRKLKGLTPKQRAAFWKEAHEEARKAGLPVVDIVESTKRKPKRKRSPLGIKEAG